MEKETIQRFRRQLRKLERIMEAYLRQDTCCHGVSIAQCHALLAVEHLGQASLNPLAEHIGLDKSTLSRTVESLVKKKLLMRKTAPQDRRITLISLTDQGRQVCKKINEANDSRFCSVLSALDREPEAVVDIFEKLVTAMDQCEVFNTACTHQKKGVN